MSVHDRHRRDRHRSTARPRRSRVVRASARIRAAVRRRDVGALLVLRDARPSRALSGERAQVVRADAANLYGTYTMLVYLTPVIGGFLADRLIGTRRSLVVGAIVIAMGHFTLAFPGMPAFYLGLGPHYHRHGILQTQCVDDGRADLLRWRRSSRLGLYDFLHGDQPRRDSSARSSAVAWRKIRALDGTTASRRPASGWCWA